MNTVDIGTTNNFNDKATLQNDHNSLDREKYLVGITHLGSGKEQSYYITGDKLTKTLDSFRYPIAQIEQKENIFITGFKNLLKKVNFLELNQKYMSQLITAEEFESEIHNKPQLYTIEIDESFDEDTIPIYLNIVDKVKDQLEGYSFNDVSEIFSLPPDIVKSRFITLAEE